MAVKMAVKHVTLRAWSDNSDVAPVKINQGDILSRTIIMTLLDSTGAPIDLALSSARVHFSKPDGTVVYLTASIVNAAAGIISVTLDSQCTAVPGLVKSIVQVTGPDGENLFFAGLTFVVGAINIEGSIISSNEFTALTDALKQVQGIANKVDKSTTINGHSLEESFSLTSSDIGAIDNALKGAANGIPTLNSDGKVVQDPASYGKVGGAPLISNLPQSTQLAMLHPDGTLSSAGCGLPQSDNGKGPRHYTVYPDGSLHEWGYVADTITITTAYGSMYIYNHYNLILNHNFVGNVSAHINIASSGALIGVGVVIKSGTQNVLDFNILSPVKVSNLPVTFLYDVWGWWRT
jgi:hypothetical protein